MDAELLVLSFSVKYLYKLIRKKGTTSKNDGNNEINTLGFRGEALHSLAKVSQSMIIRTTAAAKADQTVQFDMKTMIKRIVNPLQPVGTTVKIDSLFELLPVRRYELLNKYRQQLKKIDEMVKQYCLIYPYKNISLRNIREGKEEIITLGGMINCGKSQNQQWKERISIILGPKIADALIRMKTKHIDGWILGNIESGSSRENSFMRKNLYYMYLNNRPIDPIPKIQHLLNQIYRKYNKSTKYGYIINLVLPFQHFDVNLAPNKRQILINQALIDQILEEIRNFIQNNVVSQVADLNAFQQSKEKQRNTQQTKMANFFNQQPNLMREQYQKSENHKQQVDQSKKNLPNQSKKAQSKKQDNKSKFGSILTERISQMSKNTKRNSELQKPSVKRQQNVKRQSIGSSLFQSLNQRMSMGSKNLGNKQKYLGIIKQKPEKTKNEETQTRQKPFIQINQEKQQIIHEEDINKQISQIKVEKSKQNISIQKEGLKGLQIPKLNNSQDQIEKRSTHTFNKQQFQNFQILGQFNRGFIVCLYLDNFYLVDQHAASQKSGFQKIMKQNIDKIQLNEAIQLNPIEIQKLEQNSTSLRDDGFQFEFLDRGVVFLTRAPNFLGKIYGKKYFLKLLEEENKLQNQPDYYMAAASKACRKAVMIGDVLQKKEMINIVKELSKLQSPWNCPHGRPTLISLGKAYFEKEEKIDEKYTLL